MAVFNFFPTFGAISIIVNNKYILPMIVIVVFLIIVCVACMVSVWMQNVKLKKLVDENKMKSTFISNLNNEIRTPLKTVSSLAEVITGQQLYLSKSEKQNIADQIKGNTTLINTLLDEVMFYIDPTTQGHTIEDERLSPNFLCRRCLEAFQQRAAATPQVKVLFKRTLSDDFFVNTDPHIVQLIVNKLLQNACRFTKEGEVAIGCSDSETPGKLTIYVQDTGSGIPKDRRSAIFTWFEHPCDMRDVAEMDLSITQRLANRIGGIVTLDEQYTEGTRLLLILPIR